MKNIVNDKFTVEYFVTVFVNDTKSANLYVNQYWHEIEADDCRAFEKKFDNMNDATQCYLVQYARDDIEVLDCNLIAEYCMDAKLVGEEIIDDLPAVNGIAHRIAGQMLKRSESRNEFLSNELSVLEPITRLNEKDQKQILDFAKMKLEAQIE